MTITEKIANYGNGTPEECAKLLEIAETTLLRWGTEKPVLFEAVMLGLVERRRLQETKVKIRFLK